MSSPNADATSAQVPAKREVHVEFSPVELQAPLLLRIGAMLIDYLILIILPISSLVYFNIFGENLNIMTDRTLWFLSILLFLANIVLLPLFTGRSIGKLLAGLDVVRSDGSEPDLLHLALRQTVGYLLTAATLGLGFIWCVFSSKGRTLHDYLTDTIVVRGIRRVIR